MPVGRFDPQFPLRRVLFSLAVVGAYVLAFFPLYRLTGPGTAALVTAPVIAVAWLWGLRGGLIVGLLTFPLNTLPFNLVGLHGWDPVFREGGGPGQVMLVLIGAGIGQLRDLGERLRVKIIERKRGEEILRLVVEGTSSVTGGEFFRSFVRHLATALQVRYTFVAELADSAGTRARTLALWMGEDFGENIECVLADTPCENVVGQAMVFYPERVQELFPKDGWLAEIRPEGYLGVPIFDSSGKALGHFGVLDPKPMGVEISYEHKSILKIFAARAGAELERRRAVQFLEESEKRYRGLVESSLGLICTHDLEGTLLSINPAAAHALGYEPAELAGRKPIELLEPSVRHFFTSYLKRIREQKSDRGLTRIVAKDGTERIWAYRNVLLEEAEGKPYVLGHAQDITELKRVEEALKFTQFALDYNVDPAFWIRSDGHFAYVNDAASRRLGYSREELLSMTVSDIDPDFPPEAWPGHRQDLKERGAATFETRHRTKEGGIFPVEVTANHLEYKGKEYNCALARDIMDRKRAEEEIQRLNQELERRVTERTAALHVSEERYRTLAEAGARYYLRHRDGPSAWIRKQLRSSTIWNAAGRPHRENDWRRYSRRKSPRASGTVWKKSSKPVRRSMSNARPRFQVAKCG